MLPQAIYHRIIVLCAVFGCMLHNAVGQGYVLKDHQPDTTQEKFASFDTLPLLCDSFYNVLVRGKTADLKLFAPDLQHLKATFDTLEVEYNFQKLYYRQQYLLRNIQVQHKKLVKNLIKNKLRLDKSTLINTIYKYAKDDKGNVFCYVTYYFEQKKRKYEITFLAILLNKKWFVGDEIKLAY